MDCRLPPPLTDLQLMDVLDGEADETVQQHLAHCPSCTSRLSHIREFEMQLKLNRSRQKCCTPDELTDYALELLDSEQQRRIQAHLDTCARCRAELSDFRAFLQDTEDPTPVNMIKPDVLYHMPSVLGQWVIQPIRSEAPAVRGKTNPVISGEAHDGKIHLVVELVPDNGGIILRGAVMADDQAQWRHALFTVTRGTARLALATLNPDGTFTCGPFPTGPLNINITARNGDTLVLKNIE